MSGIIKFSCACTLLFLACFHRRPPPESWQISYSRVQTFFGSIDIKIGTDSCYCLSQAGIYKNPPVFRWKSSRKKLNNLYRQIEKFKLEDFSAANELVTEVPYESLELRKNGKIVFEVVKHQQTSVNVSRFDSVLAMLMSFVSSENNGWKY
jgi:hypothetical protein